MVVVFFCRVKDKDPIARLEWHARSIVIKNRLKIDRWKQRIPIK